METNLHFKKNGGKPIKQVIQGEMLKGKTVLQKLEGNLVKGLWADKRKTTYWRAKPMPEDYKKYYGFTQLARELNELTPEMREDMCPTDSRLRKDMRYLEQRDLDRAVEVKKKLEQAQRVRRDEMDEEKRERMWFKKTTSERRIVWTFNGKYWPAKENKFRDITFPIDLYHV